MRYYDKNGTEILAGMHIRHNNGDVEEVFATVNQDGEEGLGISATNPAYAAYHDCEWEYYPLSNFDLTEWEVVIGDDETSDVENVSNTANEKSPVKFDAAFIEKPFDKGITRAEINALLDKLDSDEVYVADINATEVESYAVGFIARDGMDRIFYDLDSLGRELSNIMNDMANENPDSIYTMQLNIRGKKEPERLHVWFGRNP